MSWRAALVALTLGVCAIAGGGGASADWLSRLNVFGAGASGTSGGTLEAATARVKTLQTSDSGPVLAARVGDEGHWTFVNAAGERFTAGTPDELRRAVGVLAPEAQDGGHGEFKPLTLVLAEDSVLQRRAQLAALPKDARLMMAFGGEAYPLIRQAEGAAAPLLAEVRPNLLVEIGERPMLDEAIRQLARPMMRARIRVVALQPNGPQTLPPSPRLDPQTQGTLTDGIDPVRLPAALGSISGQTVVLAGRLDGGRLMFRASGVQPEQALVLKDLVAAAATADVNLIVLHGATAHQPGVRNLLWQKVSVNGLDAALERAHLADFLAALGIGDNRLVVSATQSGPGRVHLRAVPVKADRTIVPGLSGLSGLYTDMVAELAGSVAPLGVEADLRGTERQSELDARLIPGIPAVVQYIYAAAMALGVIGWGVAAGWWNRLWPAENREGYSGVIGYLAAQTVRFMAFVLLFVPVVAIASAPRALIGLASGKRNAATSATGNTGGVAG